MVNCRKLLKFIVVILLPVLICVYFSPVLSVSAKDQKNRVIVSMGDSYSSGEGVPPFYDDYEKYMKTNTDDRSIKEKVTDENWLAHRSIWAWSGQLALPEVGIVNITKHNENPSWYFVASSGAETKHILRERQVKPYSKGSMEGKEYLPKQIDVLRDLKTKRITPDYVTLTIGGNDAGFTDIVMTAAYGGYYFAPCNLTAKFISVWGEFYKPNGIRSDLYDVYKTISKMTGKDTCILVAGYPQLFNPLGGKYDAFDGDSPLTGCLFNAKEAMQIDANVSLFNNAIENLVEDCKNEGMNIEFVSVEEAFYGHGAYSKDPFINPVIIGAQSEDLDESQAICASAYSIHPNIKGICAYRDCVQHAINVREGLSDDWKNKLIATPTPTSAPMPTATSTPTPTPTPAVDLNSINYAYREVLLAYESFIRDVEQAHDPAETCAITDITGDGIPELIILYSSDEENGIRHSSYEMGFLIADIRIYTVLPGDNIPTEMLHLESAGGAQTQGTHYYSDIILLSNGNLLVEKADGDEGYYVSYTEYELDGYSYQEVFNCRYTTDWEDNEYYYFNKENVNKTDFDSKIDNYMSMFSAVLSLESSYSFSYPSSWISTVANTPKYVAGFDEAWKKTAPVISSEPKLTLEQAQKAFENYWNEYRDAMYFNEFDWYYNFTFIETLSDENTCVYKEKHYLGANCYYVTCFLMDLTTGSVCKIEYQDNSPETAMPIVELEGITYDAFNGLDYLY